MDSPRRDIAGILGQLMSREQLPVEESGISEDTKKALEEVITTLRKPHILGEKKDRNEFKRACRHADVRKQVQGLKLKLERDRDAYKVRVNTERTQGQSTSEITNAEIDELYDLNEVLWARYSLPDTPYWLKTVSRRDVITLGAAGFLAVGSIVGMLSIIRQRGVDHNREAKEVSDRLEKKYGFPVTVAQEFVEHYIRVVDIQGREAQDLTGIAPIQNDELRHALLKIIERELSKYPPEFVKNTGTKKITAGYVLMHAASRSPMVGIGGTMSKDKSLALLTYTKENRERFPRNVHHELAHTYTEEIPFAEWIQEIYGGSRDAFRQFMRLNLLQMGVMPEQFFYLEDMAFTIDTMMIEPAAVLRDNHPNQLLRLKMRFMKNFLERKSNGRMNNAYWRNLSEGKIDDSYWSNRK
jgi:hypothetical protein